MNRYTITLQTALASKQAWATCETIDGALITAGWYAQLSSLPGDAVVGIIVQQEFVTFPDPITPPTKESE